ncbi:hypothetical protein [Xanthobacter agilis]|uniref:Uncharacterized protein n=1 Tax=Xanthobacter agilis TaxID=47492 RepID=A0ABU0LFW9_XANAG|nr:hypothetical protein [Xanthobacter agilis]MDQ0505965.1 hypothetical protein [Xanthobacter agilis]
MRSAWKTLADLRVGGAHDEAARTHSAESLEQAIAALRIVTSDQNATPTQAVEFSRGLMGQYRARDFVDAETFAASLATVFQNFQRMLCRLCIDPMVGLPAESKFPPTVQEVREWLDREAGRLRYYEWRAKEVRAAQLAGPKAVAPPVVEPRASLDSVAALVAALAPKEGERVRRRHIPNPAGVDHSVPYPILRGE